MGKMNKTPFSGHGEKTTELLGLIHTDVCGPMITQARGGYSYFITFTDDFSRYGFVYLMKHKSEAFDKFLEYQSMVEKQTENILKSFDQIEEVNTYPPSFSITLEKKGSSLNGPLLTHHN